MSPLGQLLQDHYGWRGGFLILGSLLLNCCVCAALMRPLEATLRPEARHPGQQLLDLSIFKDRGFLVYTLAASIMVLGLFVPPVFVVNYAKDMGVPDARAAFLLTVLDCTDVFARPLAGLVVGTAGCGPTPSTSSASPYSLTASLTSLVPQPRTTPAWWSSVSSLASPMAWGRPAV